MHLANGTIHFISVSPNDGYLGLPIQNDITGGLSDTLVNELQVIPLFKTPSLLVTTTTIMMMIIIVF